MGGVLHIKGKRRIIALGDIHGDLSFALRLLTIAKVIAVENNILKWIGGNTIVVQVGDQIDSCRPLPGETCEHTGTTLNDKAEDIEVLKLFTKLHNMAQKDGGMVLSLIGNHEIMNVLGDMRNVSKENLTDERADKFKPGGEYAKLLAETRYSVIIINNILFAHAGVISDKINNRDDIIKINKKVREWLLNKDSNPKNFYKEIDDSIFWNRILGALPPDSELKDNINKDVCDRILGKVLTALKIDRMIIGHTPQFAKHNVGINGTCDGKVIRVDIGGSESFSKFDKRSMYNIDARKPQALEIFTGDKNEGFRVIS